MAYEEKSYVPKDNFLLYSKWSGGCGGSSQEQKFFDYTTGNEIIDLTPYLPSYPKKLTYGNLELSVFWKNRNEIIDSAGVINYGDNITK